jgi:hypothetical protein
MKFDYVNPTPEENKNTLKIIEPENTKDYQKYNKDIVDYYPPADPKYQASLVQDPMGTFSVINTRIPDECPFCRNRISFPLGCTSVACKCGAEVILLYRWEKANLKK